MSKQITPFLDCALSSFRGIEHAGKKGVAFLKLIGALSSASKTTTAKILAVFDQHNSSGNFTLNVVEQLLKNNNNTIIIEQYIGSHLQDFCKEESLNKLVDLIHVVSEQNFDLLINVINHILEIPNIPPTLIQSLHQQDYSE